jgi:hypothetical protein
VATSPIRPKSRRCRSGASTGPGGSNRSGRGTIDHERSAHEEDQQLRRYPVHVLGDRPGDVQQQGRNADRQPVEADHQGDGEAGVCGEGD